MNKKLFLIMLCLLTTLFLLPACSDDESIDTPKESPTPVSDGDWQTVSAKGGTIERGDISITVPQGTFSKDTKVAITEISKGKKFGDREASAYYQLTLPTEVDKQITVKIKGNTQSDDVCGVALETGFRKSVCEYAEHFISLETSRIGDEYTIVLPEMKNGESEENLSITLGLVDTADEGSATKATRGIFDAYDIEGKVKNVDWYFEKVNNLSSSDRVKFYSLKPKLNAYIKEALEKIHELGFAFDDGARIPFVPMRDEDKPNAYGYFNQSYSTDAWNTVELNMVKLSAGISETDLKQTIIHEILHYYQSGYDPRNARTKKWGGEENVLCEAASVWVEQFMDNGNLNAEFVYEFLPTFIKGLEEHSTLYPNTIEPTHNIFSTQYHKYYAQENENYAKHGYAMSTLLYYLTSSESDMSAFGIDKNSIVELFKLWRTDKVYQGKTFLTFRRWLTNHNSYFLETDQYDEFLIKLISGKIIQHENINPYALRSDMTNLKYITSDKEFVFESQCYNLGCYVQGVGIGKYTNSKGEQSLEGKDVVVKQLSPDVNTYVFAHNANEKKFELLKGKTVQGDSLVFKGEDLAKMFGGKGVGFLWLVTTNHSGQMKNYKATVQIRDKEEEKSEDLNITQIFFNAKQYAKPDNSDFGDSNWEINMSSYSEETYKNVKINTTKKDNSLHVEFTNDYTYYSMYYIEESLSFDIDGYGGDMKNWVINNVKAYHSYDDISQHDVPVVGSKTSMTIMEVSNLRIVMDKCSFSVVPGIESILTFRATPSSGLEVSKFAGYYEDFYGRKTNLSYINDSNNSVELTIYYDKVYPME